MEDVVRRLGVAERNVSELEAQVGSILATAPHLATKVDLMDLRLALAELRGEIKGSIAEMRSTMTASIANIKAQL